MGFPFQYCSKFLTSIKVSKIEIRPCIPEDVDQAIPLIYSSGPHAFSYVFKTKKHLATDFLSFAFKRNSGEFSYDNHWALLVDDQIVGLGTKFSHQKAKTFTKREVINICRYYKSKAPAILLRGLKLEQVLQLPKKNEVCIAHLGVNPKERSKGYGRSLIEFLIRAHSSSPNTRFVLDISEQNPRAKVLYEKLGFRTTKFVTSKLKNRFGFIPNHHRMEVKAGDFKL